MGTTEGTTDTLGRPLRDLRISVIDRCNFRCPYCMPAAAYGQGHQFLPPDQWLSFDEIERLAGIFATLGVDKLRFTGGEPLLRPELPQLIARLTALPGIRDTALTTNGVLLRRHARALYQAGLGRVTVSLDSLRPATFRQMNGERGDLDTVLDGIDAAREAGFDDIKINVVVQRGVNDRQIVEVLERLQGPQTSVRFIEYMDVGNRNGWRPREVVPSAELRERIAQHWALEPLPPRYPGEVARRYRLSGGRGEIGFVSSITEPFCRQCVRARLSADGRLFTCLFASEGFDLRQILRHEPDDQVLRSAIQAIWAAREDRYSELRQQAEDRSAAPAREKVEMYRVGG